MVTQRAPQRSLKQELVHDVMIVALVGLVLYGAAQVGILAGLLAIVQKFGLIGSFIAGMFFTSAITITPAAVVLGSLATTLPLYQVAFVGALGGVIGDLAIFGLIKNTIASPSLKSIPGRRIRRRMHTVFNTGLFKWLAPVVGALIIASPLPDELGIALMGISKTRIWLIAIIAFVMNFLGILMIGSLANAL
jgi:hypothetical protein